MCDLESCFKNCQLWGLVLVVVIFYLLSVLYIYLLTFHFNILSFLVSVSVSSSRFLCITSMSPLN